MPTPGYGRSIHKKAELKLDFDGLSLGCFRAITTSLVLLRYIHLSVLSNLVQNTQTFTNSGGTFSLFGI